MASLAHRLLLAGCALALAGAASIPDTLHEPAPASNPEHLKEEQLRAEIIPVEVVVENVDPSIKANEVSDDEEVQRPEVDLSNPGPPQRQEHETQNPENHAEDELKAATIKENIEQTRLLLKEGFKRVSDDIRNWVSADDQSKIQTNLQNFRSTFSAQIKKLDDELHALGKPKLHSKSEFNYIASHIQILQDNFNNGVDTLSAGVNLVGALKSGQYEGRQESAGPAAPAPAPAPPASQPAQNLLQQFWDNISNSFTQSFSNVASILQGNGQQQATPPAGAQADQSATTSQRPPFLPGLPSLPSLPQLPPLSSLPSAAINYFNNGVQGFFGQIFPQTSTAAPSDNGAAVPVSDAKPTETKKPAEKPEVAVVSQPAPVDKPAAPVLPAAVAQPLAAAAPSVPQPAAQGAAQPQPTPAPEGPIRQMLNNNPVVQSIQSAVQRITNSIANPERPRETEDKKDPATKGGFYGKPPLNNGSGDNHDSHDSGVKNIHPEEDKPILEDTEKIQEVKPEVVAEKTE